MKPRARWALVAGGLFAVLLLLVAGTAAHVAGIAEEQDDRASTGCVGGAGSVDASRVAAKVHAVLAGSHSDVHVSGLSHPKEQIRNARVIVATGIQMDIPARGQVIALATALQESGLRNLSHGDRDSLGLFQQRPSKGWGSRDQILDPAYAAARFYRALRSVKGWQEMPVTVAAQKVQKSAYPDAYTQHEALARALQRAIAPSMGGVGVLQVSAGSSSTCATTVLASSVTVPDGYRIPLGVPPQVRMAIRWALAQLGTPYQWGGSCTNPHGDDPAGRCDCSSLVQRAYGVAGITLPRTTYDQVNQGHAVPTSALRPGDLLFTRGTASRPEHVLMAIGDGLAIQAPSTGDVVKISKITDQGTILAARRIVDETS